MRDEPGKTASEHDQRQILDVNEALLVSSVHQHELAELVQRAEAAARESEERYRTLFDLGPVAVYSCDVSGVIRDFNRVAAELWGCQPMLGDTHALAWSAISGTSPNP